MAITNEPGDRDGWARLRFAVVGPLLASPPPTGPAACRGGPRELGERIREKGRAFVRDLDVRGQEPQAGPRAQAAMSGTRAGATTTKRPARESASATSWSPIRTFLPLSIRGDFITTAARDLTK